MIIENSIKLKFQVIFFVNHFLIKFIIRFINSFDCILFTANKSCDSRNEDYLDELLKSFPEECKNQESDIPFFSSNNYCNTNILKSDVSVANQNKSGLCEINDNFDIDELINEVLQ